MSVWVCGGIYPNPNRTLTVHAYMRVQVCGVWVWGFTGAVILGECVRVDGFVGV